jgi:hypothetical protein
MFTTPRKETHLKHSTGPTTLFFGGNFREKVPNMFNVSNIINKHTYNVDYIQVTFVTCSGKRMRKLQRKNMFLVIVF